MKYDFDKIIERRGTDSVKHDMLMHYFGENDLLPMWVADMDFRSPDFVLEAIRHRTEHEVLGYTFGSDNYFATMRSWLQRHYNITAAADEMHFIPGIVAGIAFALQAFTLPGDRILILTPVYPPFVNLPSGSGRTLVCSKLKIVNGRFTIDFDDLSEKARGCKMMILANPHNPGGTVWSRDELHRIAEICHRESVIIIDDEIHADLTLPAYQHTALPTVSSEAANNSIMFFSPSKTFNIAGLSSSICYIANDNLRRQFFNYLDTFEVANGNVFAFVGAEAAYAKGEEWLKQLLEYLTINTQITSAFLKEQMSEVKAVMPEASYLAWLDFSGYGYSHEETWNRLLHRAHVALNDGTTFGGDTYRNCFRLNIGCPKATLIEALERIRDAMK
ncbi:MAG: pyridoxal phosphate-dependent aminotransferase [Bacteroidales bacterium]|nr:pyridoxal phosphate-dependent aminotransferase [Bacteroidales bacterium]